jgi:methylenetetrahydrofolate dehydrogenase (NADP+)/methenyltetrahydrofolate cyclohydrolase
MEASIIDGFGLAAKIRAEIKLAVSKLKNPPGLTVLLVGENPASQVYVGGKEKAALECGFNSKIVRLEASVSEQVVLEQVQKLNADPSVHGILVQLPLPKHMDAQKIMLAINPAKDVDGFHPLNLGKLMMGDTSGLVACTPQGVMKMIESTGIQISGKHAVVLGRSNIVGKPVAQLLLNQNATVTICHSKTQNLAELASQADILVAAVGQPLFVTATMVKPGACVIDVGIHRTAEGRVVGDVDFESVKSLAGFLSPVPKGVGPMTIACLLQNTLNVAQAGA